MIPCESESPSPVPSPTGFVVKNGSKIRLRTLSGMPGPASLNQSRTPSGPRGCGS
jgi:hypothetical protein